MGNSYIYHQKNNCFDYLSNIEKIKRLYDFKNKKLKIIDLGCGDGRLSGELVSMGHEVFGMDCSWEGVKNAEKQGVKSIVGDLEEKLPFNEGEFDMALLLDTHEHLYDQEKILKNIFRIIKEDGKVIIAYPNHFDLRNRLSMLLGKGIVHWAHRKYENAKSWSYSHVRFLLLKEFEELLNKNNFYIKKIQYNFLSGGIIPGRFTPSFVKKVLLMLFPQLLTGKYIVLADKNMGAIEEKIYLSKTPPGL